jgi:hypothetical protein
MRFDTFIGDLRPYMPWGVSQRVYANDVLTIELAGSAVAGDVEAISLLIYYPDLPGISARFISPDELKTRGGNITMVENTISTGTAGGYSGGEAISVEQDRFAARQPLVGTCDTGNAHHRWRSPDNLLGGPGGSRREMTADWFKKAVARLQPLIMISEQGAT